MSRQAYKLVGVNPLGNVLEVSLYADDVEGAGRQFDFRYGALGYRRGGEPQPPKGKGKRERRRRGVHTKEGPPPGKETDGGRSPYTQKSQASD
jgi:hypothetical protein